MAPGYREIEVYFTKNSRQSFPVGTLAEKDNSRHRKHTANRC